MQLQPFAVLTRRQRRGQRFGYKMRQLGKLPLDEDHAAIRIGNGDKVGAWTAEWKRAKKRRVVDGVGLEHERQDLLGGLGYFLFSSVVVNAWRLLATGYSLVQLLEKCDLGGVSV
jgi:hypothetical protein